MRTKHIFIRVEIKIDGDLHKLPRHPPNSQDNIPFVASSIVDQRYPSTYRDEYETRDISAFGHPFAWCALFDRNDFSIGGIL